MIHIGDEAVKQRNIRRAIAPATFPPQAVKIKGGVHCSVEEMAYVECFLFASMRACWWVGVITGAP